jgi:hypothetical protein
MLVGRYSHMASCWVLSSNRRMVSSTLQCNGHAGLFRRLSWGRSRQYEDAEAPVGHRNTRDSLFPAPGCSIWTRKMKDHAFRSRLSSFFQLPVKVTGVDPTVLRQLGILLGSVQQPEDGQQHPPVQWACRVVQTVELGRINQFPSQPNVDFPQG